jgi:hypothetical protein
MDQAASWVILRSSTVVCDDVSGEVTQTKAVHRALNLYRHGLVAMMPGVVGSTVDAVTTAFVADGIARLALRSDASGRWSTSARVKALCHSSSCSTSRTSAGPRTQRGANVGSSGPQSRT